MNKLTTELNDQVSCMLPIFLPQVRSLVWFVFTPEGVCWKEEERVGEKHKSIFAVDLSTFLIIQETICLARLLQTPPPVLIPSGILLIHVFNPFLLPLINIADLFPSSRFAEIVCFVGGEELLSRC